MSGCTHLGQDPRVVCPHPGVGSSGLCLWHNPAVAKSDAYVKALFLHADVQKLPFAETHLAGIDLKDLTLTGRDFRGADLRDAVMDGCNLGQASLSGANLRRASLRHADLRGADLRAANLTGTNLVGADLRGADLAGAVLEGTVLLGADLREANLAGAQVTDFQWNRLTRFQGIRGLDAKPVQSDRDTTQVFLAPVALDDLDTAARLALDLDPDLRRTRVFTAGRSASTELAPPDLPFSSTPSPVPSRRLWLVVPALAAGLVLGGGLVGVLRQSQVATDPTGNTAAQELAALKLQREADQTQIRTLQEQATSLADKLATTQQSAGADGARVEVLRQQLLDAQADLARLLDADDRAAVAKLRTGELDVLNRDLAGATAKQERLAQILADGVNRTRTENEQLAAELGEARTRLTALVATQTENIRLGKRLQAATAERDQLAGLYQTATTELTGAKRDIERYLARINGSQLAGLLTEDGTGGPPLMPVVAGRPVSLGGDYLVTLTVDQAPNVAGRGAQVDLRLVIQRPTAAANPDATVVLYDARKRPLRRIATSFPHVDQGAPFVTLNAAISCDRPPAYVRVLLAPGIEDVAAR